MYNPHRIYQAASEILYRGLIRKDMAEWARYKGYPPAPHHQLIIDHVAAFLQNDDEVLLLHAPPGSAKSTFLSVLLPPWFLSNYPGKNVLAATHNTEFAMRWGRRVRNIVRDDGSLLGIKLDEKNAAVDRWALVSGGEYYGVGAGVGISGFRADLGVCDDLFGSREDAYSDTIRAKRVEWYRDDFGNRLKPNAKRILMNTRWHEEDIAGYVIGQIARGEVRGKVIDIKAIAEQNDILGRREGAWLWDEPAGYDYAKYLKQRKREVSPMMWAAMFQQRPAPEEGDFFKAAWFKPYAKAPPRSELKIFGGSDYAMTADGGDYTVHVVVGLDVEDNLWLLDIWRRQADPREWVEAFCDLVTEWKPLGWAEENVQITSGIGPYLELRQRARKAWVAREQFATRGDKAMRAQSIRGRMSLGGLMVPTNAHWYANFKAELLGFPSGKHDDQVDAIGLCGQLIDVMMPPQKTEPPPPKKPKLDWFESPRDLEETDWKVM